MIDYILVQTTEDLYYEEKRNQMINKLADCFEDLEEAKWKNVYIV